MTALHPGCILFVDTYTKLTGPLRLKESEAAFAGPLGDLQEAVSPYGTSLVVVHHSGRGRAGEGAVAASRGTTALPAAVSHCVGLSWFNRGRGRQENRVLLQAEGRGDQQLQLLIEQQETGWISHGDATEAYASQQAIQLEETYKIDRPLHWMSCVNDGKWEKNELQAAC
jgi:hypothetical protein